jgi:hypothetical protein
MLKNYLPDKVVARADYDQRARDARLRLEQAERLLVKRGAATGFGALRVLRQLGAAVGGGGRKGVRRLGSPGDGGPCETAISLPAPAL